MPARIVSALPKSKGNPSLQHSRPQTEAEAGTCKLTEEPVQGCWACRETQSCSWHTEFQQHMHHPKTHGKAPTITEQWSVTAAMRGRACVRVWIREGSVWKRTRCDWAEMTQPEFFISSNFLRWMFLENLEIRIEVLQKVRVLSIFEIVFTPTTLEPKWVFIPCLYSQTHFGTFSRSWNFFWNPVCSGHWECSLNMSTHLW